LKGLVHTPVIIPIIFANDIQSPQELPEANAASNGDADNS